MWQKPNSNWVKQKAKLLTQVMESSVLVLASDKAGFWNQKSNVFLALTLSSASFRDHLTLDGVFKCPRGFPWHLTHRILPSNSSRTNASWFWLAWARSHAHSWPIRMSLLSIFPLARLSHVAFLRPSEIKGGGGPQIQWEAISRKEGAQDGQENQLVYLLNRQL